MQFSNLRPHLIPILGPLLVISIIVAFRAGEAALTNNIELTANNTSTSTPIPTPIPGGGGKISLVREDKSGRMRLLTVDKEYGDLVEIVRWNNYIFFDRSVKRQPDQFAREVYAHNLDNGETTTIFDSASYISEEEQGVVSFYLIGDTLFFAFPGYLEEGGLYSTDLPPKGNADKITSGLATYVEHEHGYYWVVKGFGDGLGYELLYSLLKPEEKSIVELIELKGDAYNRSEFIGVDGLERFLVAHSRNEFDEGEDPIDDEWFFTHVNGVSLDDPSKKAEVISESQMPDNIWKIAYSESTDKLLLFGDKLHLFSVSNGQQVTSFDLPERLYNLDIIDKYKNYVCLGKIEDELRAEINILTGEIRYESQQCLQVLYPPEDSLTTLEEKIRNLDLPSNYYLVYEDE